MSPLNTGTPTTITGLPEIGLVKISVMKGCPVLKTRRKPVSTLGGNGFPKGTRVLRRCWNVGSSKKMELTFSDFCTFVARS